MTEESPFARQARRRKVDELVELADAEGVSADELPGEGTRARLLAALSERRGKPTDASLATWRAVWKRLRRAELEAEHPGYARAVAAEPPYSTVPGRSPFAA